MVQLGGDDEGYDDDEGRGGGSGRISRLYFDCNPDKLRRLTLPDGWLPPPPPDEHP